MPSRAGATSVAPMINRLSHATIWVLDQDEALAFYTGKLGFEVRTDQRIDDFRWVTVGPPGQPDLEIVLLVPGPPMMPPEAAEQIKALIGKGAMGAGVFATDDPAKPRFQVDLSWDTAPKFAANTFAFAAPPNARAVARVMCTSLVIRGSSSG